MNIKNYIHKIKNKIFFFKKKTIPKYTSRLNPKYRINLINLKNIYLI